MSETAWRALERTALAMGAREGTEPEDDPLMASVLARLQAGRRVQGRREGLAQGHREGFAQGRMEAVSQLLEARGIAVALDITEDRQLLGGLSADALVAAALACTDAADFRRRVLAQRGRCGPGAAHGGDGP